MRFNILFLIIIYFVFPKLIAGQQLNYKRYSIEEGLPQSEVCDIVEDSRGTIWTATNSGGLCRFNGSKFKVFTKEDGLSDNSPLKLIISREDNLWVFGTNGINQFDGIKFVQYPINDSYLHSKITHVFEDSQNNNVFWIKASNIKKGQLLRFDGNKTEVVNWKTKDKLKDAYLFYIAQNPNGSILLSTNKGCFDFNFETKELQISHLYKKLQIDIRWNIRFLLKDNRGREWYAIRDEDKKQRLLRYYSGKSEILKSTINPQHGGIQTATSDKDGNLWVGLMGYIIRFDGESARYYSSNIGIHGEAVCKLIIDREENIWIGTRGGGLIRYTDDSFLTFTKEDGLPSEFVRAFHQDKDGDIWFGLTAGSLGLFDGYDLYTFDFPGACNVEMVTSIFDDPDERVTFATNKGFYHLIDGEGLVNVNHLYDLPFGVTINDVVVEKDTIWAITYNSLMKYHNGKTEHYSIQGISFLYGLDIHTDGSIWLHSHRAPYVFDRDSNFTQKETFGELSHPTVLQSTKDKHGWVNIASFGEGLIREKDDKVEIFNKKNSSLNTNIIYSIISDKDGNLWLGTQKGISQVVLNEKGEVTKIRNLDRHDGFRGLETNGRATMLDNQGNLWFGTIHGAIRFSPNKKRKNETPPITHITALELFYKDIKWTSDEAKQYHQGITPWNNLPTNLILPHHKNHLTFHFEGINLAVPEKVSYKWRLKGLEKDWSPISNESKVTYSNLPDGDYTFQLMSANNENIWTPTPTEYSFIIKPPFWRTIWFYILVILASTASIISLVKIRERTLIHERNLLETKVSNRTAEILQQKEEIEAQRDEIASQRDEIEALLDEITAQRDFVTQQRDEVAKVNKSLTDSIKYAKRIQQAVLPPQETLQQILPESFIYFKPRDIVSGDFYWVKKIANYLIVAAADCTGHGVPGAFMSMLGMSMMNELVRQHDINTPNVLLEELRKYTKQSLRQTGRVMEPHDGMDIAVIAIDLAKGNLQYAGAHNPLYITRRSDVVIENRHAKIGARNGKAQLFEFKATPNPIGIHAKEQAFENHHIKLEKGDAIYLFSDGYVDQFGGRRGYKFMTKRFKELLVNNYHLDMCKQADLLSATMNEWQNEEYDQVDDMLIIGIRY